MVAWRARRERFVGPGVKCLTIILMNKQMKRLMTELL
jgi:hypothetical protein